MLKGEMQHVFRISKYMRGSHNTDFKLMVIKNPLLLLPFEEQRLEAAQMKFLRQLLGITKLHKEKNQRIREKMGAQNIVKEIKLYQKKWLQHVQRMDTNRLPKQALQYEPKGRRNVGRPRKRWRDQLHLEHQGTGNTPKHS